MAKQQQRAIEYNGQPTKQAPNGGNGPTVKNQQVPFNGYVRCELSRVEREAFKSWADGLEDGTLYGYVCTWADGEYKLSVGPKGQDMMASLHDQDPKRGSYGYMLTAFAGSADMAIRALAYKHYETLAEDWQAETDPDAFHVR